MDLIPLIENGCLRIMTHATPSHFVDVQTWSLMAILRNNILTASSFQHFRRLRQVVPEHLFVIVRIANGSDDLRNSPRILLVFA